VFELNLNQNELDALNTLIVACIDPEVNTLPSWDYMGQNIWTMNFDGDVPEVASIWAIETADVA
jgi:hypothetical protein